MLFLVASIAIMDHSTEAKKLEQNKPSRAQFPLNDDEKTELRRKSKGNPLVSFIAFLFVACCGGCHHASKGCGSHHSSGPRNINSYSHH